MCKSKIYFCLSCLTAELQTYITLIISKNQVTFKHNSVFAKAFKLVSGCKIIVDQLGMREKSHDRSRRERSAGIGNDACVRACVRACAGCL